MITELETVEPDIIPGAVIQVIEHRIRNFRLHGLLESLARLQINILEIQSNDTSSVVAPSDVRDIWSQFNIIKDDVKFAREYNDAPTGNYQHAFVIKLISQREVQRIRNVKVKSVVKDLWVLGEVILGLDSANMTNFLDLNCAAKIDRAIVVCEASMSRWVGSGEDAENVGLYAPAFGMSGELTPDVDSDFAQRMEPSKSRPLPQLNDVPDTPAAQSPAKVQVR